jgi:hypothetical protein
MEGIKKLVLAGRGFKLEHAQFGELGETFVFTKNRL